MAPTPTRKKRRGYLYAVGRRKTAVARVRFVKREDGKGEVEVNEKSVEEYFPKEIVPVVLEPITLANTTFDGKFTVRVVGGGTKSQAEAIRHGIARILVQINEDWRPLLRSKGCLTRDSRMKERKKPGLKRARRAPQWSKR